VSDSYGIKLRKNSTDFGGSYGRYDVINRAADGRTLTVEDVIDCAVGDTLEVQAYSQATNPQILSNSPISNYVVFEWLGNN
jgi:hypothetical protein